MKKPTQEIVRRTRGRDTGNDGINTLSGGAGNDTLSGGAGVDVMNGGAGNDTYYVDNAGDQVIETVVGLAQWWNDADNLVTESDDALNGGGGDDLMDGGAGNDRLNKLWWCEAANDSMLLAA